jgi:hypothetical protein
VLLYLSMAEEPEIAGLDSVEDVERDRGTNFYVYNALDGGAVEGYFHISRKEG